MQIQRAATVQRQHRVRIPLISHAGSPGTHLSLLSFLTSSVPNVQFYLLLFSLPPASYSNLPCKHSDFSAIAKCLNDAHGISQERNMPQEQRNKEKAQAWSFKKKNKKNQPLHTRTGFKTISAQHATLPPQCPKALLKGQENTDKVV